MWEIFANFSLVIEDASHSNYGASNEDDSPEHQDQHLTTHEYKK